MNLDNFYYSLFGYTAKLAHIFGALIWLGGVLFMAGVATPILNYYKKTENYDPKVLETIGRLERRLVGFNWMAIFSILFGGIILSYHSQNFSFFSFNSLYNWLINLKIVLFFVVAILNYLMSKSYKELLTASADKTEDQELSHHDIVEWRINMLRKLNVYVSFAFILILSFL